jgi:PAS domain S-box-containing protein
VNTTHDSTLETPIPTAPLESILCEEALQSRPSRPPDYEKENRALVKLVSALADSPNTIFQTLADTILEITESDSAGLSLLTKDGKTPHVDGQRFYWPAIAGKWSPHVGGGTPRNFGPCGDVLDRNTTILFTHWERRYPYLSAAVPFAEEGLLVPFYVEGKAVGTIWGIMHSDRRKFDAEDDRIMASLGKFASSAYEAVMHIEDLKTTAELAAANAKLQLQVGLLQHLPVSAWTLKPDGTPDFVNQVWLEFAGQTLDFVRSHPEAWMTAVHPEDRETAAKCFWEGVHSGQSFAFEIRSLRAQDRTYRWHLQQAVVLRDAEGKVLKFVGTTTDIDDQKRAEQELRARELDARSLLDNMPGFLARVSPVGTPEIFNRPFLQYLGTTLEELKKWRTSDIVHPDDLAHTIEVFGNGISGGQPFDFQYRLRRFDGVYRWFQVRVVPVRNVEGQILHWNSLVTDIDEQQRAEEELRVAQSELARVMGVMAMGELTASIAHEVNQPLSGIITNASTCLRMLDANPPNVEGARETARRTIRDGQRASDVITRLRTLYSKKEPALELMDLNETAREVTALLSTEIQRTRVTLRQEFAEELPPALGDRIQLQQVILNLVRNAVDAMSTINDRPRELLVRTEREEGNQVRLSVKDSGVGLTPQAVERIFEAFYTTKTDGMGIGLSISRSIIEAHQGRIWASLNDGPGSTFSFVIPCRAEGSAYAEIRGNRDPSTDAA